MGTLTEQIRSCPGSAPGILSAVRRMSSVFSLSTTRSKITREVNASARVGMSKLSNAIGQSDVVAEHAIARR